MGLGVLECMARIGTGWLHAIFVGAIMLTVVPEPQRGLTLVSGSRFILQNAGNLTELGAVSRPEQNIVVLNPAPNHQSGASSGHLFEDLHRNADSMAQYRSAWAKKYGGKFREFLGRFPVRPQVRIVKIAWNISEEGLPRTSQDPASGRGGAAILPPGAQQEVLGDSSWFKRFHEHERALDSAQSPLRQANASGGQSEGHDNGHSPGYSDPKLALGPTIGLSRLRGLLLVSLGGAPFIAKLIIFGGLGALTAIGIVGGMVRGGWRGCWLLGGGLLSWGLVGWLAYSLPG